MKKIHFGLTAIFSVTGVGTLLAGCSGEAESWSEHAEQEYAASRAQHEPVSDQEGAADESDEPVVLAELQPSDSHRIVVEEDSDGEISITETFNIDLVAYEDSFTYNRFSGLSAEEAYDLVAGERWSQQDRDLFRDVGERLDASVDPTAAEQLDPDLEAARAEDIRAFGQLPDQGAIDVGEATASDAVNGTAVVEKACSDPAGFDFQADDGRFKQTFCGENSRFCVTSGQESNGFATYGFDDTRFMAAVGLSQSFCNTARFRYWKRHYAGFPTYGISDDEVRDVQLPPRNFVGHHRSNSGSYAYKARIDHVSGPAIRRIAFSIHVDSARPPWFNSGFPSSF